MDYFNKKKKLSYKSPAIVLFNSNTVIFSILFNCTIILSMCQNLMMTF